MLESSVCNQTLKVMRSHVVGFHSGENQCSLVCGAASEPFSLSVSFFVERKQKETRLDMKSAAVAAESAARNQRLVQVSNKRITSFVGFQKISGCVSAPSGSPREPRPFADGGGAEQSICQRRRHLQRADKNKPAASFIWKV